MKHPESRSENPRTVFLSRGSWGSKIFTSLRKTAARKRKGIIGAQVAICASPATETSGGKVVEEATISLEGMLMNLALNESIPRPRRDLEIQGWWILSRARARAPTGLSSRGPRQGNCDPRAWQDLFPKDFTKPQNRGRSSSSRKLDLDWSRRSAFAPTTDLRFTFGDVIYSRVLFSSSI